MDSLKGQLSHQKERNNFLYWNYHLKTNVAKVDTAFIRPDSSVISYYLGNGKLLMQESAEYDNQNQKTFYIRRHYNEMERVVYVEHWVSINDSRFVAKMTKTERMEYDRLGRLILHVIYFANIAQHIGMTLKVTSTKPQTLSTNLSFGIKCMLLNSSHFKFLTN